MKLWFQTAIVAGLCALVIACGKDDNNNDDDVQFCGFGNVYTSDHGCLRECPGQPGFGFHPTKGCVQGVSTSCNFNQVFVNDYGCLPQCSGLPSYGFVANENKCLPGIPSTYGSNYQWLF